MQHLRATGCIAAAGILAVAVLTFVAPSVDSDMTVALPESHRMVEGKLELHVEDWTQAAQAASYSKELLTKYLSDKYPKRPKKTVEVIVDAAFKEAKKHDLNPLLVLAVIEKESSLRHAASNRYGAKGLMQVVPRWHPEKMRTVTHPKGLFDPVTNIQVGTSILAEYLDRYSGNVVNALNKYSGSARNYPEKVQDFKEELERVIHPVIYKDGDGLAAEEAA